MSEEKKDRVRPFDSKLDSFYFKIVRSYLNKNGKTLREVTTIEQGIDRFYIINDQNNIILKSSSEVSIEPEHPSVAEMSKLLRDSDMDTSKGDVREKEEDDGETISKEDALQLVQVVLEKFKQFFKNYIYTLITEKKFPELSVILDIKKNQILLTECMMGGMPGLKAYLIRELFKNTGIKDRGFKILFFLTSFIALNEKGEFQSDQTDAIKEVTLEQQKGILKNHMTSLTEMGKKFDKEEIFLKIAELFYNNEYKNLEKGGMGYFLEQFYYKEMEKLKGAIINTDNKDYITNLFARSLREPLFIIQTYIFSYLKALTILRLYSSSTKEERSKHHVDDRNTQDMIIDIIKIKLIPK